MKHLYVRSHHWLRQHWRRFAIIGGSISVGLIILVQCFYPGDRLLPYTTVDNLAVGGWQRKDAVWVLDHQYADKQARIYFGKNAAAYRSPSLQTIGTTVQNQARTDALTYPWSLRLVPTSLFWAHLTAPVTQPQYARNQQVADQYVKQELGDSCQVTPQDANIVNKDGQLKVVPSVPGGTCQLSDVVTALTSITPTLRTDVTIRIPMQEISPAVNEQAAQRLASQLTQRLQAGVAVKAGDSTVTIPTNEVIGWLDFAVEQSKLTPHMNAQRAADYLAKTLAPKVAVAPGVSKVTTYDFTETARQDGPGGQTLNNAATLDAILAYLTEQSDTVVAATSATPPRVEYTRSYSSTDEGFAALLANYAKDHTGSFSLSIAELSDKHRHASYNDTTQFATASTYKLFVAYSTLKRVEAGTWQWGDQISGGRDLTKCFDDMIVKSDNGCAETLLGKIGYRTITDEMQALGLKNTTFMKGDSPLTTSGDLTLYLGMLASDQMLSPASCDRLTDALRRNIYRQGIPAGTSATVGDKVGFMNALLHDAAIVYSPSGTYVLTIMSEGSSWATIADLTKQIEALRSS
jgi:beta-lactamase class A